MIQIGPISSIFDYATYFLMLYFFNCILFNTPQNIPKETADFIAAHFPQLSPKDYFEHLFHTGWFVESILTQTLIVHIIRTRKIPFLQSIASPFLLLTTAVVMAIGAWLPYSPFANYLGLVPLPGIYWLWILLFLVCYSILTHFVKVSFHKKHGID